MDGPIDWMGASIGYDDQNADVRLSIAAVSMVSTQDKASNLKKMSDMIDTIMTEHPSTQVIVFPEIATGWYWLTGDTTGRATSDYHHAILAEAIPGPSTETIGSKAEEYGIHILFGLTEQDPDGKRIYNSAALIGPNGDVVAIQHKNALVEGDTAIGFTPGQQVEIVDIDGVQTALIICYEGSSVQVAEQIVHGSAELVLQVVADESGKSFLDLDRGFARSWNAWNAFGNKAGVEGDFYMQNDSLEFAGAIGIISPTGSAEARADMHGDGYVFHEIGVYKK